MNLEPMDPTHHAVPELDWQAFQYVLGEMDADEMSRFEDLLEIEQSARDAVVNAVELVETVSACSLDFEDRGVSVGRPDQGWKSPLGWSAVGAAACLCILGMLHLISIELDRRTHDQAGRLSADQGFTPSRALAQAWSTSRDLADIDSDQTDQVDLWSVESDEDDDDASEVDPDAVSDADLAVPGWMLTALVSMNESDSERIDGEAQ